MTWWQLLINASATILGYEGTIALIQKFYKPKSDK